jgi:hypothetical protein
VWGSGRQYQGLWHVAKCQYVSQGKDGILTFKTEKNWNEQ